MGRGGVFWMAALVLVGCGTAVDARDVVTIGDVTGHGISAAFLMSTTQLMVRTVMMRVGDPGKCLEEVNGHLCVQVFNGQFVTMLICVIDLENDALVDESEVDAIVNDASCTHTVFWSGTRTVDPVAGTHPNSA